MNNTNPIVPAPVNTFNRPLTDTYATVPAMIKAIEHDDEEVVKAAVENLSFCEDKNYFTKLMSFINHINWEIRIAAIKVLAEKGVEGSKELLKKRLEVEDDDLVISSINEALSDRR